MRIKWLLPVFGILSIIFIASFFIMSPTFITSNGDTKHFDDRDYSFDMNNDWTVYEYDDLLKTPFLSTSPDLIILNPVSKSQFSNYDGDLDELEEDVINTSSTNDFDVAIVKTEITKHDSLPEGITLADAYKADSLYTLMDTTGGFSMEESTQVQISGKEAYQFIYEVSGVTYQDTWIENNGHYIRILSQAPSGFYDDAQSQFDTVVNTFNIK